jgi:hypothetical protein
MHAEKTQQSKIQAVANMPGKQISDSISKHVDNRPEAIMLKKLKETASNGPRTQQLKAYQAIAENYFANKNPQTSAVIQGRFKKGDVEYSFLQAHDLEGNPYLAGTDGKNWSIKENQPSIDLKEEKEEDLYTKIDDDDEKQTKIFHNLSVGREQRISINDQKAILNPFKTYTFGKDKVYDVAVFNVTSDGEADKAELYRKYKTDLMKILDLDDRKEYKKYLDNILKQIMPLIVAEDYRTAGARDLFNERWATVAQEFLGWYNGQGKNVVSLKKAIENASTNLPWAGTRGKQKFREKLGAEKGVDYEESVRPISGISPSPAKKETAGKWQSTETENKKEKITKTENKKEEEIQDRISVVFKDNELTKVDKLERIRDIFSSELGDQFNELSKADQHRAIFYALDPKKYKIKELAIYDSNLKAKLKKYDEIIKSSIDNLNIPVFS